jgi:hypothetical protein
VLQNYIAWIARDRSLNSNQRQGKSEHSHIGEFSASHSRDYRLSTDLNCVLPSWFQQTGYAGGDRFLFRILHAALVLMMFVIAGTKLTILFRFSCAATWAGSRWMTGNGRA